MKAKYKCSIKTGFFVSPDTSTKWTWALSTHKAFQIYYKCWKSHLLDCISNLNKTAVRKSCKMCINANYINTQATGCVSSTCTSPAVTRVATATCGLEGDHLAEPGPCSQSLIKEHYIQPILFDRHPWKKKQELWGHGCDPYGGNMSWSDDEISLM